MGKGPFQISFLEEDTRLSSSSNTYNVRIERFHIDVADGAAGERPHLCFVLKGGPDLERGEKDVSRLGRYELLRLPPKSQFPGFPSTSFVFPSFFFFFSTFATLTGA